MSPKTELPPELGDGYELTFARLQRMFRARGASPDDAADLAQETAARLIVHLRRRGLDPNPLHEGISALVNRIAMNLLIDRARAGRSAVVPLDDATDIAGADDPADVVSREQRVRAVRSAVAGLSQRHRRALALSLEGLGPAEIAEDFGIERNAADALLYRARRRLAQTLRLDQIGIVVAIVVARVRGTVRRTEQPILQAAPAGMHLATGLVGLAMSASFALPPATAQDANASTPVRAAVTASSTSDARDVIGARSPAGALAAADAARPADGVSIRTRVPGTPKGRDDAGIDLWRERDGRSTTGAVIDRGSSAACSAGACSPAEVLR